MDEQPMAAVPVAPEEERADAVAPVVDERGGQGEPGVLSAGESPATEEELAEVHARNAFIRAADAALADMRQRSYEGKLTAASRWRKRAFAPEGMDAAAFEERLLDYIDQRDHAEAKPFMGAVRAPRPLEVELEGGEVSDDEPLPDLDVSDVAVLTGKKGIYLYSVALLSHSFAKALYHTAEDNDLATFVDVVRTESSVYPRPVAIQSFSNPPYLWPRERTRRAFDEAVSSGSFPDIHEVRTSYGTPYYYSDLYLSEAQAASLAQWDGVERGANP